MGSGVVWCGSDFQRFLIGFSLSQVDIGDKTKSIGPKEGGGGMPDIPAKFRFVAEIVLSPKRGKWP
jgi:hypothetical protein